MAGCRVDFKVRRRWGGGVSFVAPRAQLDRLGGSRWGWVLQIKCRAIQIIVPLTLLYSYMQLIITSCIVKPRSWPGSAYVPLTKPARHTCCMLPLPTTQQQQAGLQSWTTIPNSQPQGTLAKYSEFEPRACDVS